MWRAKCQWEIMRVGAERVLCSDTTILHGWSPCPRSRPDRTAVRPTLAKVRRFADLTKVDSGRAPTRAAAAASRPRTALEVDVLGAIPAGRDELTGQRPLYSPHLAKR